ncbi:MAG: 2-hydroxychromene-2-carboxylate isomerase [Pseudomonadota bacterium]
MANIDCYYYGASPFAYLGHDAFVAMAAEHGATVTWKPVNLFDVWEISGAVPPPKRPPVRQRYRMVELQRVAHFRDLPINTGPAHWPFDATLADGCAIAIQSRGGNPASYIRCVLSGVWAEEKNFADEAVISAALTNTGHDAESIVSAAKGDDVAATRAANTQDAIGADAVGVPAYVLNGEVFWGQDRIDHLSHALATGRAPFIAG